MTTLKIFSQVHYDEDEDQPGFEFKLLFNATETGLVTAYVISEPYLFSIQKWESFIKSMEDVTPNSMSFYQGNGEGRMFIEDGILTLRAGCSGAGGDVAATMEVVLTDHNSDSLVKAFREMITDPEAVRRWVNFKPLR